MCLFLAAINVYLLINIFSNTSKLTFNYTFLFSLFKLSCFLRYENFKRT